MLGLVRAALDERRVSYQYLDGSTPTADRRSAVAAFQAGEGDLFLINLRAGGFGLLLEDSDKSAKLGADELRALLAPDHDGDIQAHST